MQIVNILKRNYFYPQLGFINVVALLLLVGGVIAGTYLVQQRTNLLPQAAEKTVACDGQTLASQSEQSQNDFNAKYGERAAEAWVEEHEAELAKSGQPCPGSTSQTGSQTADSSDGESCRDNPSGATRPAGYRWVADCAKSCTDFSNHSQCPKNESDPQNVKPETSRWCYNFKEGGRCLMLKTSSSDPGLSALKASQNISQMNQTQACTNGLKTHLDSKVAIRLALYEAIMAGVSEACVKVDLGLDPHITRQSVNGTTGRLLLCSGADSKPNALVLKWRVATPPNDTLELLKDPPPTDPNNFPSDISERIKKAKELLKVSAPTGSSTSTPASDELKPGGKECTYIQENKCYKGNCKDGSQSCDFNVNCGYVPGYSSGEEVACP